MIFHNILTCSGEWMSCSMSLLGVVILFFVIAALRKWVFEGMNYPFSFLIGEVGGIISYIIGFGFTGSYKIALVIGLVLGLVLGYFGAAFFDDSSGDGQ